MGLRRSPTCWACRAPASRAASVRAARRHRPRARPPRRSARAARAAAAFRQPARAVRARRQRRAGAARRRGAARPAGRLAGGAACLRAPLPSADASRDAPAARRPQPQATALEIGLAEPSRDTAHLLVLLRERLAQRCSWRRRRSSSRCRPTTRQARPPPNGELFPTRQSEDEGLTRLLERLQARLGADQVQRLIGSPTTGPSGRAGGSAPTRAGGRRARRRAVAAPLRLADSRAATARSCAARAAPRPVWLLPVAEPLAERRRGRCSAAGRSAPVGARADRGRLVGRRARRARLLHRPGRRRRAGVDLPRATAAVGGGREPERPLVPSRPLRVTQKFVPSAPLFADHVKPRRRSESLSQRLPLTPQTACRRHRSRRPRGRRLRCARSASARR